MPLHQSVKRFELLRASIVGPHMDTVSTECSRIADPHMDAPSTECVCIVDPHMDAASSDCARTMDPLMDAPSTDGPRTIAQCVVVTETPDKCSKESLPKLDRWQSASAVMLAAMGGCVR